VRLTTLLDLTPQQAEETLCRLVVAGTVWARIDRPAGIVNFRNKCSAEDVMNDWRSLRKKMSITEDPAYLHHHGKPVVAVWGIGFSDDRQYTLAECRRLIEFLKNDAEAGGCTVMVGVPAHWRELDRDAISDPQLLEVVNGPFDAEEPWLS